jgi:hypothetical protein
MARPVGVFPSEVDTGSREENTISQKLESLQFNLNGMTPRRPAGAPQF